MVLICQGVAAVYSATPDDIDIIKTWPGGNGTLLPTFEANELHVLTHLQELPQTKYLLRSAIPRHLHRMVHSPPSKPLRSLQPTLNGDSSSNPKKRA